MRTVRLAALAALVGVSSMIGSAHYSPANPGDLGWLSNKPYVECLRGINFLSGWNNGHPQTNAEQGDAMTDAPSPASQAPDQAQQPIERLSSRLARVETQLKAFQYVFPGFAILLVALLFMQLNKPSTVNTKIVIAESFGVQNDK